MGSRDEDAALLATKARTAWEDTWKVIRWDYFVRLKWRTTEWKTADARTHHAARIDTVTANDHLERLIRDLRRAGVLQPGAIHILAGVHCEPYLHAHALVKLPRRRRAQFLTADEFASWFALYWYHGEVYAEVYDPERRSPTHGGAVEYLAREAGSVVCG